MTDAWTIEFNQPDKRLSLNDRLHWAQRAARTSNWRTAAYIAAVGQLGLTRTSRNLPPCLVRVTFPVSDNRRRDADNPAPTTKAIVDGLVDAGVWADDDTEHVGILPSRFNKTKGPVVVELTLLDTQSYAQINRHENTGLPTISPQADDETIRLCPTPQAPT